jgi:hypothetical protein
MAKIKTTTIIAIPDWKGEATNDKSLGSIVLSSIGVVGRKSDLALFAAMILFGIAGVVIARVKFEQLIVPGLTAAIVQQWASFGAAFSIAILGFLITGFSVFATVTRPGVFHVLAKFRQSNREISEFKFVFYNFLYVFSHYIIHLTACMIIVFSFTKASPVWYAGYLIWQSHPEIIDIAASISGVIVVSYSLFALLLLRSFLWNLYSGLLFAIFVEEPASPSKSKEL